MRGILRKDTHGADAPTLMLHNTMGGSLEPFSAMKPPRVKMYTCGPTVYDYAQIGNLRSYVFADILKRTLTYAGYEVEHIINFTDFGHLTSDADVGEDKMMIALKREGKPLTLKAMREVAEPFIDAFKADTTALNILPPKEYTRASDFVTEEIALIKTLVEKGYTYETSDGVYFDVSRFPAYGKLGNIDIEKLKEGARVDANPEKKHPADFALWKKGELGWESDWGTGFPGWHIECTAMIFATLGKQIDIHTGGIDHIATHHNGEIAQAEAATGRTPYARFWLHNEFITIESRRIGKSEGNAIHLSQLKERGYAPEIYRYWLLTGHYRSPMNFTFEALDGSKQALFRLKRYLVEECGTKAGVISPAYKKAFTAALYDDLNTPKAIALIWDIVHDAELSPADKKATIHAFDAVLGLGLDTQDTSAAQVLGVLDINTLPEDVQKLISDREKARRNKDWDAADELRQKINLAGYTLEDTPKGPRVTKN